MRALSLLLCLTPLSACIDGLTQVAGTGVVYHTRCTADMLPDGSRYVAQCEPEACAAGFVSAAVNHVAVALDPGRKLIGIAERVCHQDLARASGLFNPALLPPPEAPATDAPGTPTPEAAPAAAPTP